MRRLLPRAACLLALVACGETAALQQPRDPPVWPLANITKVSPRSHKSIKVDREAESALGAQGAPAVDGRDVASEPLAPATGDKDVETEPSEPNDEDSRSGDAPPE